MEHNVDPNKDRDEEIGREIEKSIGIGGKGKIDKM